MIQFETRDANLHIGYLKKQEVIAVVITEYTSKDGSPPAYPYEMKIYLRSKEHPLLFIIESKEQALTTARKISEEAMETMVEEVDP